MGLIIWEQGTNTRIVSTWIPQMRPLKDLQKDEPLPVVRRINWLGAIKGTGAPTSPYLSFIDNEERQPAVRTINGIGMYRITTGRAFPLTDQLL